MRRKNKRQLAMVQPMGGQTVLHCGHLDRTPHHFFKDKSGKMHFVRPDGSEGDAEWMVVCDDCFRTGKQEMLADAVWKGDQPAVYAPEEPQQPRSNT